MIDKNVKIINHQYNVAGMFRAENGYKCIAMSDDNTTPDLVVFTGGHDLNPKLYGEEPLRETRFNNMRDNEDLEAWNKYKDIPKVGICRGGQFLNVMSGGAMWQHVTGHGGAHLMHNLLIVPGIEEQSLMVTSTHHQMMIPGEKGFVLGIALDNVNKNKGLATEYRSFLKRDKPRFDTEVVWYPETKSLCFQPHPEYNSHSEMRKYFFKLLNHFFN